MEPKPGIQTTEFWLAFAALVLVSVGATFSSSPWAQLGGAIGAGLIAAGYGWSRGTAKKIAPLIFGVLTLGLLASCTADPAVKQLHQETGKDMKAVLEVYADRIRGAEFETPSEEAALHRELAALGSLGERILKGHKEVGDYLEALDLFPSNEERDKFLDTIRTLRPEED